MRAEKRHCLKTPHHPVQTEPVASPPLVKGSAHNCKIVGRFRNPNFEHPRLQSTEMGLTELNSIIKPQYLITAKIGGRTKHFISSEPLKSLQSSWAFDVVNSEENQIFEDRIHFAKTERYIIRPNRWLACCIGIKGMSLGTCCVSIWLSWKRLGAWSWWRWNADFYQGTWRAQWVLKFSTRAGLVRFAFLLLICLDLDRRRHSTRAGKMRKKDQSEGEERN